MGKFKPIKETKTGLARKVETLKTVLTVWFMVGIMFIASLSICAIVPLVTVILGVKI